MVPTSSSNEQNDDCADWVKMVLCELMFLWVFCHPIVIQNFELATGAGEISLKRGRWDESYGGCRPHGWTESGKNNCRLLLCCSYLYYLFVQFLIRIVQVLLFCSRLFVQTIWVSSTIATLKWIVTFEVHSKYGTDPSNLPPW